MELRVYYEDTDAGGVVYYASYLRYFERARTEHLERRGVSLAALQKEGYIFAVVSATVNYKAPAFYGDRLEVKTLAEGIKGSSFTVHYTIRRLPEGTVLVTGLTRMACVTTALKPRRMPYNVRKALLAP